MANPRISAIIPTWKAAAELPALLEGLQGQSLRPDEIRVIDSSSPDATAEIARRAGCAVTVIPQAEFNHGGTRNQAALSARGDILVFMTQDALPANAEFLLRLVEPIVCGRATASFARQLPRPDATPLARFQRLFQYPSASGPRLRFVFSSNSASAVQRAAFMRVGGFPPAVPCGEDMALTLKLRRERLETEYVPEACVVHSHNLRLGAQFRRYFDTGAMHARARALLDGASPKSDGVNYAKAVMGYLWREQEWGWMAPAAAELATKWWAYQIGRHERWIPQALKLRISQHPGYWQSYDPGIPWQPGDVRCETRAAAAGAGRS